MYFSESEHLKDFRPRRDSRAFFEDFHILKSDKLKNVSRYDLHEYIEEEKSV